MSDSSSAEQHSLECYHNKFHGEQCRARATWRSRGVGNSTDGWTWCDEHVTDSVEYRERIDQ